MTGRPKVLLAAACAGAIALTGLASPAQAADRPLTIPESAISELKTLVKDNAAAYGGLAQYPDTRTLVVTLPTHAADPVGARSRVSGLTEHVNARADSSGPAWRVEYRTVERSLRELTAIKDGIPTRQPFAGVAADRLATWSVDARSNTVAIGVTRLDQDLVDAADATYGDAVRLHEEARPQAMASRLEDSSPWSAGLRITGPSYCTGGFGVHHRGVQYMLTAGHCGPVGSSWYNGGTYIGRTDLGFYGRGGWDSALIRGGSYHHSMYIGGVHSTTYRNVTGTYDPPEGATICASGSFSGASCALEVQTDDACVVVETPQGAPHICHLTRAPYTGTGVPFIQSGDSGGPVYANFGSNVKAVGIIVASGRGGLPFDSLWYHPIGELLALYGAALITP